MTDPLIGMQLDEYRLENLLGQGGMARVYRGLDTGLQRYAAIKVIDTPYQQDEGYIARFEREARAIAALDHPHIVTIYRYGRSQNLLYLSMKFIEGADLHTVLSGYEQDGQLMPFPEIVRLLREMGSALDYAHSRGVIHRDVKPSNVMLDDQGYSYITDFGLALLADVGTRGEILGSPHYIAPEQAVSSAGAVPQSDLYALGVILYRMATGQLPFVHDDVLELLMMHMTVEPPSPRAIRPEISQAFEMVLLRALAKKPEARFPSGQALANAVEDALAGAAAQPIIDVPTLTIMDRVALDMETLPPIPALTPPISETLPTASPSSPPFTMSLRTVGGVALLLALVAMAVFFFRGRAEEGEAGTHEAVVTDAVSTETVNVVEAAVPGETTNSADDTSATLLPLIATVDGQSTIAAIDTPAVGPTTVGATAVAPISTPLPASTETLLPAPTETPLATASPNPVTAVPSPTGYQLLIATNKEDSLFVVNQSGESFPLALLRLGRGKGAIQGTEWGMAQLEPDDCVTAWKDSGNPQPPNVNCQQVGERLIRKGPERFWKDEFEVFYEDVQVGVCSPRKQCVVDIES